MAIELPDDWPARGWVEETPLAHLETLASDAASGTTTTRWPVVSWSSTRELASSALPGQIRGKTGLSIGSATARIKRDGDDFPWKRRDVNRLTGSSAELLLAPQGATPIPTGQFRVAEADGDITTFGVDVELDERTANGRNKTANVLGPAIGDVWTIPPEPFDPVWLVSQLAGQMGYGNGSLTPGQDGYAPLLDVPLQGSIAPAHPTTIEYSTTDSPAWGASSGSVALTTDKDQDLALLYPIEASIPAAYVVTMDADNGYAGLRWVAVGSAGELRVRVRMRTGDGDVTLLIESTGSNGSGNTATTVDLGYVNRDPANPNRIQLEVTLTEAGGAFTSASVRVQREPGEWTAPVVHAMANSITRDVAFNASVELAWLSSSDSTAYLAHFSVVDATSPTRDELLSTTAGPVGRIYLEPMFGTMTSPWLDPDLKVWGAMQAIVDAWQAALITDVYGDLRLLNRNSLVGVNDFVQERSIAVGLVFEDLPWVLNDEDQADRLVVTFRPASTVLGADPTQVSTVWEATDATVLYPGVNEVFVTLDYVYPLDLQNLPFERADDPDAAYSHAWDAHRYNNGTGGRISESNLDFSVRQVSSSTWAISINNKTGQPCHLVDASGQPYFKIRSRIFVSQGFDQVIERGVPATEARRKLDIDLSTYAQTAEDAEALADFIWGRVNTRSWRADTVTVVPDYRLDLGDVVAITHARTGVKSNALVTKVHYDGRFGEVTQKLDLVLIPPTWEDFQEAWVNNVAGDDWDTFDALWDAYTWEDFDRTPTATTEAEIQGAM